MLENDELYQKTNYPERTRIEDNNGLFLII